VNVQQSVSRSVLTLSSTMHHHKESSESLALVLILAYIRTLMNVIRLMLSCAMHHHKEPYESLVLIMHIRILLKRTWSVCSK